MSKSPVKYLIYCGRWWASIVPIELCATVHAYRNECPHAGNRLEWKPDAFLTKDGSLIMCSVHGANFRIHDGLCVAGPCMGRALTELAVSVVAGRVEVRLAEADDA